MIEKRPIIVAIVGASGTGKTTLAMHLQETYDVPSICSYTTRPMRDGEVNGREHIFVSPETKIPEEPLAYTFFGGHHYWANLEQATSHPVTTYVIDEKGLIELQQKWCGKFHIIPVLIRSNQTFVDKERQDRDLDRVKVDNFRSVVLNNGTLKEFLFQGTYIIGNLINNITMFYE